MKKYIGHSPSEIDCAQFFKNFIENLRYGSGNHGILKQKSVKVYVFV